MAADVLSTPAEIGSTRNRLTLATELVGEYQDSGLQGPRCLVWPSDGRVVELPAFRYSVAGAVDGVRDDAGDVDGVSGGSGRPFTGGHVLFVVEERLRVVGVIAVDTGRAAGRRPAFGGDEGAGGVCGLELAPRIPAAVPSTWYGGMSPS
jgi:putative peptide zinc metalloprotease protein